MVNIGLHIIHRRESIILNAMELMNEFGIRFVSTKEIAKRLEISESTIFKHFPKKNDLFMALLEQYSLYDNDILCTAKTKKKDAKEAIIFYIKTYTLYYENYPAITALIQAYDVFRGIPELEDKAKQIHLNRLEGIKKLIEIGQDTNVICKKIDKEVLADIITSTYIGICVKWRMQGFNFSLSQEAIQAVNILLDAFGT